MSYVGNYIGNYAGNYLGLVSGETPVTYLETVTLDVVFQGNTELTVISNFINDSQSIRFLLNYFDETPLSPVFRLCSPSNVTTEYSISNLEVIIPVDVLTVGTWNAYVYDTPRKTASQIFRFKVKALC